MSKRWNGLKMPRLLSLLLALTRCAPKQDGFRTILKAGFQIDKVELLVNSDMLLYGRKSNASLWYEIGDDHPADNLYYNGIEIRSDETSKTISISQYYN